MLKYYVDVKCVGMAMSGSDGKLKCFQSESHHTSPKATLSSMCQPESLFSKREHVMGVQGGVPLAREEPCRSRSKAIGFLELCVTSSDVR